MNDHGSSHDEDCRKTVRLARLASGLSIVLAIGLTSLYFDGPEVQPLLVPGFWWIANAALVCSTGMAGLFGASVFFARKNV